MAGAVPRNGALIWYSYLWVKDALNGASHGDKIRRCVVLATSQSTPGGPMRVIVAPITHVEPDDKSTAVKISAADAAALGLDDRTSWVIVEDLNYFTWVGPDVTTDLQSGDYEVGFLAPALFSKITEKFKSLRASGSLKALGRDDKVPITSAKPK